MRRTATGIRLAALLALALALGACGFQLRGTGSGSALPVSWRSMYLASDSENSELTRVLRATFAANGVTWVERSEAGYILRLGPERFSQQNLSVNAQARAAEFDLQMQARFEVLAADGSPVMPASTGAVNKQMENDPRNVVGKAEEVRILRNELRTELASQIFRRISFYAASTQPNP
jgi:LPS-assembly lipoprotein